MIVLRGGRWQAGDEGAYRRGERLDAVAQAGVPFAGLPVGFFHACAKALVGGAGFLGDLGDAVAQVGDLSGEVVELALCVAPQAAVLFAVFAPLFGDADGNVFDAFEAFVGGHGFLQCSSVAFAVHATEWYIPGLCQPPGTPNGQLRLQVGQFCPVIGT